MTTNAHIERARTWLMQERADLAEPELRRAIALDPDDPEAHVMLAFCLTALKQKDEALATAERAIGLAPDWPKAHLARANALLVQRRSREAERAARQAIELDAEDVGAHVAHGWALFAQHRFREALAAAEAGLALDPEHDRCANLRAMALVQLGEAGQADLALEAALRRDPDNPDTHESLGWSALNRGDVDRAVRHYREALRLDPESSVARAGLVEALKSRNVVYRWFLRTFLLLTRVPPRTAFALLLGTVVARVVLRGLAESQPAIAPLAWTAYGLLIAFVLMTWIAEPLFNAILRLDREGRHALTHRQVVQSSWLLGTLALAALTAVLWLLDVPAMGVAAILLGVLVLPVTAAAGARGKARRWSAAAALVLAGLAAGTVVQTATVDGWARQVQARERALGNNAPPVTLSSWRGWLGLPDAHQDPELAALLGQKEAMRARAESRDQLLMGFVWGFVAFTWLAAGSGALRRR